MSCAVDYHKIIDMNQANCISKQNLERVHTFQSKIQGVKLLQIAENKKIDKESVFPSCDMETSRLSTIIDFSPLQS